MTTDPKCKTDCATTKVCNPDSGRCVLRTGKIGQAVSKPKTKTPKEHDLTKGAVHRLVHKAASLKIGAGMETHVRGILDEFLHAVARKSAAQQRSSGRAISVEDVSAGLANEPDASRRDALKYGLSQLNSKTLANPKSSIPAATFKRILQKASPAHMRWSRQATVVLHHAAEKYIVDRMLAASIALHVTEHARRKTVRPQNNQTAHGIMHPEAHGIVLKTR